MRAFFAQALSAFPGGVVVVLPRVRCLRPLRYVPYDALIDVPFAAAAAAAASGGRVHVMGIDEFVAAHNPGKLIPVLYRDENER